MFKNLRIFSKLFISHVAVGLLSIVCLSVVFYFLFQQALIRRTDEQLSSVNTLKRDRIEEYFSGVERNLEHQMATLTDAGMIEKVRDTYDFKSVVLIDSHGQKMGTTGSDSLLTALAGDIVQHYRRLDEFHILEAKTFIPVKATRIVYVLPVQIGEKQGYFLAEDNFQKIQNTLLEITGMGSSGESYLVGSDFRMRSTSRFYPDQAPHSIPVDTAPVRNALSGSTESSIAIDYRGIKVLSVYHRINAKDLEWVLLSEIDYGEVIAPLTRWSGYIFFAAITLLVINVAITWFIARSISRPILSLKPVITSLSKGIIPVYESGNDAGDEVGQIKEAIKEWIEGLKRTTRFADETGAGNFNANFTALSDEDTLGQALVRMRDRLRKLTNEQVSMEREKASALLEGQEKERKRIVLELHDGVGQLLTAIRLRLEAIRASEKNIDEITVLVNETIDEVKRISYNLMPNAIVDFGLEAALKGLCDSVRKSSGIAVDFRFVKEYDHVLSFEISIAVFRIIQEGFNNIVKHSGASQCHLHVLDNKEELYVLLKDNGRGFNESGLISTGIGLRSMKERANLLEGTLEIHSSTGEGTELEVTIPMHSFSPDGKD